MPVPVGSPHWSTFSDVLAVIRWQDESSKNLPRIRCSIAPVLQGAESRLSVIGMEPWLVSNTAASVPFLSCLSPGLGAGRFLAR